MPTAITRLLVLVMALVAAAAVPAAAQREGDLGKSERRLDDRGRSIAGDFDYYTLVLSWSPTHCSTPDGQDDAQQCSRRDGRRYAFVLHGLWPQYERGFPEGCWTRKKPYVPQPLIDSMLDIMPSPKLVIHEYKKHGTCSGMDPKGYYETSRQMFAKIKIPDRYVNPFEALTVSPDDLADEFMAANPGLQPDMLAISCGGPGNRLRDIRICFNRQGELRSCGGNENQRRLCSAARMYVPPVRSSPRKDGPSDDAPAEAKPALPQPRLIQGPH